MQNVLLLLCLCGFVGGCPLNCDCQKKAVTDCRNLTKFPAADSLPETVTRLELEGNYIQDLQADLDVHRTKGNVTQIILDKNQIQEIPANSTLTWFPNLRNFQLNNNQIRKIQCKVFDEIPRLTRLSLQSNALQFVQKECFQNLHDLSTLILSHNGIKQIEDFAFQGLPNLVELYMHNNNVVRLGDKSFTGLDSIQIISLGNNLIVDISDKALIPLKKLQLLSLSNNNIKRVSSNWFRFMTSLKKLFLDQNEISILKPQSFRGSASLTLLNLYKNKIHDIANDAFHGLWKLRVLDLSHNKLTELRSHWLQPLISLEMLYLQNNKIVSFSPNHLLWPFSIQQLWLQNNALHSIPPLPLAGAVSHNQTSHVYLDGNKIYCGCQEYNLNGHLNLNRLNLYLCCIDNTKFCDTTAYDITRKAVAPWPSAENTWKSISASPRINTKELIKTQQSSPLCKPPTSEVLSVGPDNISCQALGEPMPKVHFTLHNTEMDTKDGYSILKMQYSCRATNVFGTVVRNGTIQHKLQYEKDTLFLWSSIVLITTSLILLSLIILFFVLFHIYTKGHQ